MSFESKVQVLDHGFVQLRNIAGPTRRADCDFDADDTDPANAARMSFDSMDSGRTREQDMKLASYLMRNRHTSPFEQVQVWLEMKLPIFVARQFVRHRTCLAGSTKLIFERPCDGKAYPCELEAFVRAFADPSQTAKLQRMKLRFLGVDGKIKTTQVKDAWFSGKKLCYEVTTCTGKSITGSSDHKVKVPGGYRSIGTLTVGDNIVCVSLQTVSTPPHKPQVSFAEQASEIWAPIPDLDGYEASSLGNVRTYWGQGGRVKKQTPKLKKPTLSQGRYVVSARGGVFHVAVLVAKAFLGKRPDGMQVLHNDDNEWDNRLTNLRYGTHKENMADKAVNGTKRCLTALEETVVAIRTVGVQKTYDIAVAAAEENFVANGVVVHNCRLNETSGRYVVLPPEWYIPESVGAKASDKKQGQADTLTGEQQESVKVRMQAHSQAGFDLYSKFIDQGVAPEHARMILGLNHYTHWLWNQDMHNLMHFLSLRDHPHAQVEAQAYAKAIDKLLRNVLPETMGLYDQFRKLP